MEKFQHEDFIDKEQDQFINSVFEGCGGISVMGIPFSVFEDRKNDTILPRSSSEFHSDPDSDLNPCQERFEKAVLSYMNNSNGNFLIPQYSKLLSDDKESLFKTFNNLGEYCFVDGTGSSYSTWYIYNSPSSGIFFIVIKPYQNIEDLNTNNIKYNYIASPTTEKHILEDIIFV